jgi:hypothetical protein
MDRVFEVKDKVCASVLSRYEAKETELPPVMANVLDVMDKVCASVLSRYEAKETPTPPEIFNVLDVMDSVSGSDTLTLVPVPPLILRVTVLPVLD